MKKMAKQFFAVVVALAAFTACSDSNFSENDPVVEPISDARIMNSAVLTNANGQQISSVSADMGTYYLDIKTNGVWYIETPDNMEFTPTKMTGTGSARVPVLIGNNWAEARQLSYKVKFIDENGQMRAAGDGGQTVNQESSTNLAGFKEIVNSNIFVGYGYNPSKSSIPELCNGIEIFDMATLKSNAALVINSLSPQAKETYTYAHSESALDKIIGVSASPGGNFGPVKLDSLGVTVDVTRTEHTGSTTIQKTLNRSVYSRELLWANAMVDANKKFVDTYLSNGFKYYKQRFIKKIKNAANEDEKKDAAMEFFNIVGTHFIAKALLGCELDYRMTVDSTKTNKATSVKAALDFKWQQQVKDTAKVDSLEEEEAAKTIPDSLRKNFVFGGKVSVTDSVYHASSTTKADVKARGGEIERVNILTTGGQLLRDDLATWLLATEPEKAAMVGINTIPIYVLFKDDEDGDEKNAHDYLQKIIDKFYSLDSSRYGNWLENQRIK
jgi:hypothetical protein